MSHLEIVRVVGPTRHFGGRCQASCHDIHHHSVTPGNIVTGLTKGCRTTGPRSLEGPLGPVVVQRNKI